MAHSVFSKSKKKTSLLFSLGGSDPEFSESGVGFRRTRFCCSLSAISRKLPKTHRILYLLMCFESEVQKGVIRCAKVCTFRICNQKVDISILHRDISEKQDFWFLNEGGFFCDRQNGVVQNLSLPRDSPSSGGLESTVSSPIAKMARS